jgi:hypothetical protein
LRLRLTVDGVTAGVSCERKSPLTLKLGVSYLLWPFSDAMNTFCLAFNFWNEGALGSRQIVGKCISACIRAAHAAVVRCAHRTDDAPREDEFDHGREQRAKEAVTRQRE